METITQFRKWVWIAPLLLAAGCGRQNAPATAQNQQPVGAPPASATAPPDSAATRQPAASDQTAAADPEPVRPARREVTVPAGTALRVRIDETVSTKKNNVGDGFTATLSKPVVVAGETAIPAGTRFRGHITTAAASGRLKGRPVLAVTLDSFTWNGREHRLSTSAVERVGPAHKKRNTILIGGGAGLGAALGAIAGGGKGAAIGALAGAGAGTAGAAATGKEQLTIAAETPLSFTLRAPLEL